MTDEQDKLDLPENSDEQDAAPPSAPSADQPQDTSSQPTQESSEEDRLADVRRALLEEEEAKPTKKKWSGIFKKKGKAEQADEERLAVEGKITEAPSDTVDVSRVGERTHTGHTGELNPQVLREGKRHTGELRPRAPGEAHAHTTEPVHPSEPEAEKNQAEPVEKEDVLKSILGIDPQTFALLAAAEEHHEGAPAPATAPAEPEEEITVINKAQRHEILRPTAEEEKVPDVDAIREEALKEYSQEPLQPETEAAPSLTHTTKRLYGGLGRVEKLALLGVIGFFLVAGLFAVGAVLMRSLQAPVATPTVDPTIPYPIEIILPGGWSFHLGKGKLVDDKWNPAGPEWLEGTELCKWVALPYSTQLEAVIRTLNPDDPIKLTMSNLDQLTFKVQSLKRMSVDEVTSLENNQACLLVILFDENSDSRLVLTTVP